MNEPTNDPRPEQESAPETSRSAGAYGFTRREIIVLSFVGLIVLAFSIGQWISRRDAAQIPPWRVEDVLLDTLPRPPQMASVPSAAADDPENPDYALTDVNTAAHEDLVRLPGVGPVLADRVIEERRSGGPFKNLVDLQRVRGIGPKKAAALAGWVRFSGAGHAADDSSVVDP